MKKEICEKCKYYVTHYSYTKLYGFLKTNCGHCLKKQIKKKECCYFESSALGSFDNEISIINSFLSFEKKVNKLIYEVGVLSSSTHDLKKEIQAFKLE